MQNPELATITGDVLTHEITTPMVGWVSTSPTSAVATGPDLEQHGFSQMVAQETLAAGAGRSLHLGAITIDIPSAAFQTEVDVRLLKAPLTSIQTPPGRR